MGYRLILLAAFLTISILLLSQYQAGNANFLHEYQQAEKFYNQDNSTSKSDSLALTHYQHTIDLLVKNTTADSVLFDAQVKAGILATSARKDSLALGFFTGAIITQEKGRGIPDSLLFMPYLFAGNAHYNLFNYDTALALYNKAEKVLDKYPSIAEAERLYNKTGVLYYETGDYKKSILYFSKALSIVEMGTKEKQYLVITYKNNIASAWRKSGNYEQALEMYKRLLQYGITTDELWHNIGVTYLDAGNYKEAINCLKKVRYENAAKYNDLTKACLKKKDLEEAGKFLQTAMVMHKKTQGLQKSIPFGITLTYKGDLDMARQLPASASRNYQAAIIAMDPDFNDTTLSSNPASFNGLHQYNQLFDALVAKGRAIASMTPGFKDQQIMNTAMAAYRSAITLATHVEKSYETDEARLFLKKNADAAFHEFSELSLASYAETKDPVYLQEAFNIIENNKASVLQAELHELELSNLPGLPQELIREQKRIKAELARLALVSGSDQTGNTPDTKIRDLEIALSRTQEKLNSDPNYRRLKFSSRQVSVDSLQKTLAQDAAILSYYYIGEKLLCFYLTKNDFGYSLTTEKKPFATMLLELRQLLHSTATGDRNSMKNLSTALYDQLIRPVYEKISSKKRLIIIPYNEISYIPFETLVNEDKNELLLKEFAISYNYSTNFLGEQAAEKMNYGVLSFAPFNNLTAPSDLPVLKASEDEVKGLPGEVYLGEDATKQNFLNKLGTFPILHLYTCHCQ